METGAWSVGAAPLAARSGLRGLHCLSPGWLLTFKGGKPFLKIASGQNASQGGKQIAKLASLRGCQRASPSFTIKLAIFLGDIADGIQP